MLDDERGALVDVEWIAARLGEPSVQLVEVDVSRVAYDEGHIPGAVLWNAYVDLRDQRYRPGGSAGDLCSRSGVVPGTTAVTYGYAAPLGFWLLKASGHEDVRMLLGAREQWSLAGHEWSRAVPEPADGAYPDLTENADVLASRGGVEAAIGDPRQVLLDVRAESEYSGERFWPSGATEDVGLLDTSRSGQRPIDWLRGTG